MKKLIIASVFVFLNVLVYGQMNHEQMNDLNKQLRDQRRDKDERDQRRRQGEEFNRHQRNQDDIKRQRRENEESKKERKEKDSKRFNDALKPEKRD